MRINIIIILFYYENRHIYSRKFAKFVIVIIQHVKKLRLLPERWLRVARNLNNYKYMYISHQYKSTRNIECFL